MTDIDLDTLADELSDFDVSKKRTPLSSREERVVSGFEDIQRFFDEHGCVPRHGEERDIFERLYAVRLDRLRKLEEYRELLEPLDFQGLLTPHDLTSVDEEDAANEDNLAAELSEFDDQAVDITELRHVRSSAEKRVADDVASRKRCLDFERFAPLFEQVQRELDKGIRVTRPFELKADIEPGRWFIVGGQKAYVAEMGEGFTNDQGRTDARLRVIFDNGTESNMLLRSLQRSLNKDEAGRRITEPDAGPLFSDTSNDQDEASGTIYVLRSKSDHPVISKNRDLIHKIGVTNRDVHKRIAGARLQPTFLMADVEVVATYELYNISRVKLENLIHRIFGKAQIDINVEDRFGRPVRPREWFLVPLHVIDEAVQHIRDGSISKYVYDPQTASLLMK